MTAIPRPDTLPVVQARITQASADERLAREVGDTESLLSCERLADYLWDRWEFLRALR